jgi:NAD+ kinase
MIAGPMRNLALYVNLRRKAAVEAAHTVAEIARRNNVALQVTAEQARDLRLAGAAPSQEFPKSAQLLVSLGGDGTLLRAAHLAGPLGIPIIGVDFGRVGFLTEIDGDDYETTLEKIIRSGAPTESNLALEVRVLGAGRKFYAVNDAHIDRQHIGRIVNFGIALGGEHVATIPADGVVVSSPTGSTAYFLSSGGPIMSPKLEAIGIAPLSPHTLFSRPLIVGADETIRIELPDDAEEAQLFVDGESVAALSAGAIVEIVRAKQPVIFVRLNGEYFFHTLERKLHWGLSLKRPLGKGS